MIPPWPRPELTNSVLASLTSLIHVHGLRRPSAGRFGHPLLACMTTKMEISEVDHHVPKTTSNTKINEVLTYRVLVRDARASPRPPQRVLRRTRDEGRRGEEQIQREAQRLLQLTLQK